MAKKINNISVSEWEKILKKDETTEVTYENLKFNVKKSVSLAEATEIIETVVKASVDKDNGEYMPSVTDFVLYNEILAHYTDLTISKDIEKQYELVCRTGIMDVVIDAIDEDQIESIISSIESKIEFELSEIISSANKKLTELISRFDSLLGSIDEETISNLNTFTENLTRVDASTIAQAVAHANVAK